MPADDISRLFTFTPNTLIESGQVNQELNAIISALNGKFGRGVDNTLSGNNQFNGMTTFQGGSTFTGATSLSNVSLLKVDVIAEKTAGAGVTIDGVLAKDNVLNLPGSAGYTPATLGDLGVDTTTQTYKGYMGSLVRFFAMSPLVVSKTSGYTLVPGDFGKNISCSNSFTLAIADVATFFNGWFCYVKNSGSGVITIDPDSSQIIDGLASITLGPGSDCILTTSGVAGFGTYGRRAEYILLVDQKLTGTDGGTFTSGAWRTRDISEGTDTGDNCSVSSNAFTLLPGTYRIKASAPAFAVNSHQLRLQNTSDGALVLRGTSEIVTTSTSIQSRSIVEGQFTISASKTFELQHQCQTTRSTDGFGKAGSLDFERYTIAELWKVV